MKEDNFRAYAEYYDLIYLKMKNYQKEAQVVLNVITQFENKPSKTLLDVGCGTGEHLKHLCSQFQCSGIDINRTMIETAETKVPTVKFTIADMTNFRLNEKFDVITCLFSAIGHVQTFKNLLKTLNNFRRHLDDKGILILEPWIFKQDFKQGFLGLNTYEDENVKLARMSTSKITRSRWITFMHYLIGKEGNITYIKEIHPMLAAEYADYLHAFELAQFKDMRFLNENLWDGCRGLFIAEK